MTQNYYSSAVRTLICVVVFWIPAEILDAATVTTPTGGTLVWVPPYSDYIPASPVYYERKIKTT